MEGLSQVVVSCVSPVHLCLDRVSGEEACVCVGRCLLVLAGGGEG